jgi:hypothetical protein
MSQRRKWGLDACSRSDGREGGREGGVEDGIDVGRAQEDFLLSLHNRWRTKTRTRGRGRGREGRRKGGRKGGEEVKHPPLEIPRGRREES